MQTKSYENNTVGYWLNQIEDESIREKALANLWPTSADALAYSIFQALGMAFPWSESPEGHNFWSEIRWEYLKKEEEKED